MVTSWIIGAAPDADVRVAEGTVSGRHCRLSVTEAGYRLEDLNSTNGTYVNGVRIDRPLVVTRGDVITLGLTTPMPWPEVDPPLASSVPTVSLPGAEAVIGRAPDCGIRLDLPMISSHHARLVRAGDQVWITDLNSANGTWVDGRRLDGATAVRAGDLVSLGSHTFRLVFDPEPAPEVVSDGWPASHLDPEQPNLRGASATAGPVESWTGIVRDLGPPAGLVFQAAVVAVGLVTVLGRGRPDSPGAGAAVLNGWSVASVWFGLAAAVVPALLGGRRPPVGRGTSLAAVGLTLAQAVVAWAILVGFLDLRSGRVEALGLVTLGSAVGLVVGLLVVAGLRNRVQVALAASGIMVASGLFSGGPGTLPTVAPWTRTVADLAPSRWVFEGLLTLGSDLEPARVGEDQSPRDLVETYFPRRTARMGLVADCAAMVLMLVGLVGVVGYLTGAGGSRARTASARR